MDVAVSCSEWRAWVVAIAFAIAASLIWLAPKPKHALQMQVGH